MSGIALWPLLCLSFIRQNIINGGQLMNFDRRKFIKNIGIGTIAGFISETIMASRSCKRFVTPRQPEGPFYPEEIPSDMNADLTMVNGHEKPAMGTPIMVKGIIKDQYCRPIENAVIEIWQACHTGRYNHSSDTSDSKMDPHFQYYALMRSNSKGEYSYKTIIPGAYQANRNWIRPPHIHYKVSSRGYEELITQLYFKGENLNKDDQILRELSKDDRNKIVVEFKKDEKSGLLTGSFNIGLKKNVRL